MSIWHALNAWASTLKPWQRQTLAFAVIGGPLGDNEVQAVYELFAEEAGLVEKRPREPIVVDVSGRPANAHGEPLRLDRIDGLVGINAIPDASALTFAPSLTVVYGRNGAGKSGFARLFANACFSRHKPKILSNIYQESEKSQQSATFHFSIGKVAQEQFEFAPGKERPDLKRISFFDTVVASLHVSEAAPFEFKPSGFDVFPEMARVYAVLAVRLDTDIRARMHPLKFSDSFIGGETPVSKAVAALDGSNDPAEIRELASYGATETARLAEVDSQLVSLKNNSPKEALANLKQARADVDRLATKISALGSIFGPEKTRSRTELSQKAKKKTETAILLGSDQFRQPFFRAVGTPEWQDFTRATHALARKESEEYPGENDRCLLCERPLDEVSKRHIVTLLAFVEGDAQRDAKLAMQALNDEVGRLRKLDLNVCSPDSRVYEHLHRLDPAIETVVIDSIKKISAVRDETLASLAAYAVVESTLDITSAIKDLAELLKRIDVDIERLEKENPADAIAALELERQTLRHREVLVKLLPSIEKFVADREWCRKAGHAKSMLNPRHITEKEKDLSGKIIAGSYRNRFSEECKKLDCNLPVELQTSGQKGKTVRSLLMRGGHDPESILSEGEQKAVALADFLTEVALNSASAGIVLDDPVNSQDHQRKELIARRLVEEAAMRQVIVFTHDLPFLNYILGLAEKQNLDYEAHWIDRDQDGKPGQITLNDVPATSKAYDTAERAKQFLVEAKACSGTAQRDAICKGMGALRRTVEETVAKKLFKNVIPRWNDRVIVTGLRNISWDDALVEELCVVYEDLSRFIEGHSHTDEALGAPPEIKDLETMIGRIEALTKRAKQDKKPQLAVVPSSSVA
jgi:hypothetical protein